ncbi:MAG: STAS domain-containing protein [Chloroflexota bacterium]
MTTAPAEVPRVASRHDLPRPDRVLECDVSRIDAPDMRTVEALACLQLAAHRDGRRVRLRGTRAALRELLELAGLCAALGVQAVGEPEEREEAGGVEEEHDAGDAVT